MILRLARGSAPTRSSFRHYSDELLVIAEPAEAGAPNVEFRKGRIQDLALDLEKLDADLK